MRPSSGTVTPVPGTVPPGIVPLPGTAPVPPVPVAAPGAPDVPVPTTPVPEAARPAVVPPGVTVPPPGVVPVPGPVAEPGVPAVELIAGLSPVPPPPPQAAKPSNEIPTTFTLCSQAADMRLTSIARVRKTRPVRSHTMTAGFRQADDMPASAAISGSGRMPKQTCCQIELPPRTSRPRPGKLAQTPDLAHPKMTML